MKDYILETRSLSFSYQDGTAALKNVNIGIERGKKIAFVGVNGSGKSTLFLNFNGVLKPKSGEIIYKGRVIKYSSRELKELRKSVGIVFQDPENQLFSANVYQEVSFGAMNLKLPYDEVKNRVDEALKAVNMYDYKDKAVHFLSYGQKKRISIADILVMKPEVIIFDEPTSSLDPKHSEQVIEIFELLNKAGITVILSTHDVELAYSFSDYIFVMKDGSVAKEGIPEEIFTDDGLIESCYLHKPLVLEVFEGLVKKDLVKKVSCPPKNRRELMDMING